jgi:OmcA/MtrC family decaheme c-type cytochrome
MTAGGVPLTGLVPFWEDSSRFVRFTMTKLVPGANGGPNNWVAYTRDDGEPDYDTGSSLVDNGDGTYTFTFETDVTNVDGVTWEPTLTHRVAGQIGASGSFNPQNLVYDYVPAGGAVTTTRNIAVMETCNECHDNLVFHGRRFLVEYCVQCHNPDLAEGEGNMSFMIHRIHNAGTFEVLDDAIDYSHIGYPQDVANCRKCHNADDAATPDGGNWMSVPSIVACSGCHEELSSGHGGGGGGATCLGCHTDGGIAPSIEAAHVTANATPNNPNVLPNQRKITYELISAAVAGSGQVTVQFRILSDGTPLDVSNLPQDLLDGGRYPGLLLAYALPQGDIDEPMDYNNIGQRGAQPLSLGLDDFSPVASEGAIGSLSYNASTGVITAVITDADSQFPLDATLRAVGLQGYLRQDLDGDGSYDVSLHTPSAVVAVTGDDARREIVDNDNCASCHVWFEGHGGNRVYNINICTLCHVPNQSSSGRTIEPPPSSGLLEDFENAEHLDASIDPDDPLTYPEDAQNLKDMIHGIHNSIRTRAFTHVRGGREGYYDWDHVAFPRGASTSNCMLCHKPGTYELPLAEDLLATTVRTTGVEDGMDDSNEGVETAFQNVPNDTDWVNSPTASSCFYCHTSNDAMAHMMQNGALLSLPGGGFYINRADIDTAYESCAVCHGPGKTADVEAVHNR